MSLTIRLARSDDLVRTDALVVETINDLTVRHGFGPMATESPPDFQRFSLSNDPNGLWVAEDDGNIVGFAWSWVCGELWFLAQLFVDRNHQGRGLGNALLERTLEHARKSKARHRALITFTFNRISQGLYIRHGLFPKMPIYFFASSRERLSAVSDPALRTTALDGSDLETLAAIDIRAIGISRCQQHRYLLNDPAILGLLLYSGHECLGYAYVSKSGHIGPMAVTRAEVLGEAFATALKRAADCSSDKVTAFLPGTCESALSMAVNHGMRITFPMLLMASSGFGDWKQYLPRNPGFM